MTSQDFFATHPVFTHGEFAESRRPGSPRTVDSLLRQHAARGRIVRVRRGLYVTVPPGANADTVTVDPYLVATKASDDATVSHHAALQFHGRAYSIWSQVTFFTRRHMRPFRFGATDFVPVKAPKAVAELPDMGGGVQLVMSGGGQVRVTSCERAMVDLLHTPALGGGWEEIWRSLEMVEFFDLEAVVSYALALGSAMTAARVGLFLEEHRDSLFVEDRHLKKLEACRPRQARYLDSSHESGRLVRRWKLIVPERVLRRAWDEVA
ncbi:MAG: transcriptional regulator [Deltaproteobacteria bacterium]|nr:MAG: transcriptional regulator [Deltaproteobacteria bacterium]